MDNKVRKNSIYSLLKAFSQVVFPLITFPYISRVLHAENVGKVNFGNSIISYVSLAASLGITTYAVRECSKIKDDNNKLENMVGQIISLNMVTTFIAYIGLALALLAAKPLENYREMIIILSTTVLFTTLGADWLNTAMEDFSVSFHYGNAPFCTETGRLYALCCHYSNCFKWSQYYQYGIQKKIL